MTDIYTSLRDFQKYRKDLCGSVGLVPTMGALHQGHQALLERSVKENEHTVLTLFVNPTQFNKVADLETYPRTLESDAAMARSCGVDAILMPDYGTLYPDDYRYRVCESEISAVMEGAHRPGHFDGVLTVVLKLLLLTRPQRAYFGEKDYQQFRLIQGMAEAFFLETEIVPCPTVREADGLACSSRNRHLSPEGRLRAPRLYHALRQAPNCENALEQLRQNGFKVEYVEEHQGRRFVAAELENTRLIDNVPL